MFRQNGGKRKNFAQQTTKKSSAFVKLKQRYSLQFSPTLPYLRLPEFSKVFKNFWGVWHPPPHNTHTQPVATPWIYGICITFKTSSNIAIRCKARWNVLRSNVLSVCPTMSDPNSKPSGISPDDSANHILRPAKFKQTFVILFFCDWCIVIIS